MCAQKVFEQICIEVFFRLILEMEECSRGAYNFLNC